MPIFSITRAEARVARVAGGVDAVQAERPKAKVQQRAGGLGARPHRSRPST